MFVLRIEPDAKSPTDVLYLGQPAQAVFLDIILITRRSDSVLTRHVLEADENGLRDSTKFNESRYYWPGILYVVARPGFVAVYIAQHSALIIPSRAFPSRHVRRQFVELIKKYMHAQAAAGRLGS